MLIAHGIDGYRFAPRHPTVRRKVRPHPVQAGHARDRACGALLQVDSSA